jgi:hypothetical protein
VSILGIFGCFNINLSRYGCALPNEGQIGRQRWTKDRSLTVITRPNAYCVAEELKCAFSD